MNEQELIDGLRGLSLTEPRLGFSPDDVAWHAAKRQRRRRAILATAAGTVAIVGMAVGALLYANPGASLPLEPAGTTTTTTSSRVDKVDMTKQMAGIESHLRQALPALLPDARDLRVRVDQPYANDMVMAIVEFQDDAGPGGFNVSVVGQKAASDGAMSFKEKCFCEEPRRQSDGTEVYVEKPDGQPSVSLPANRNAAHYRADGSIVSIYHSTSFSQAQAQRAGRSGGAGIRGEFPLTDEQLIAIVTDPALNLN
jgi:hypothetical protein